jgi:hypothetical protein
MLFDYSPFRVTGKPPSRYELEKRKQFEKVLARIQKKQKAARRRRIAEKPA